MSLYKVPSSGSSRAGWTLLTFSVESHSLILMWPILTMQWLLWNHIFYIIIMNTKLILWVYVQLSRDLALLCIAGNFFDGDHKCLRTVQVGRINHYCSLLLLSTLSYDHVFHLSPSSQGLSSPLLNQMIIIFICHCRHYHYRHHHFLRYQDEMRRIAQIFRIMRILRSYLKGAAPLIIIKSIKENEYTIGKFKIILRNTTIAW